MQWAAGSVFSCIEQFTTDCRDVMSKMGIEKVVGEVVMNTQLYRWSDMVSEFGRRMKRNAELRSNQNHIKYRLTLPASDVDPRYLWNGHGVECPGRGILQYGAIPWR